LTENELSREIIGAAIEVHRILDPGLLESAYEMALAKELGLRGFEVRNQVPMPLMYKDEKCEIGYRMDIVVANKVVVEVKSVEALNDVHLAQVLTYLKLSKTKLGLLINFNVAMLKNGIRRVVNRLPE
jgi:GxxExxY protein